jgi:TatD DNase family protein
LFSIHSHPWYLFFTHRHCISQQTLYFSNPLHHTTPPHIMSTDAEPEVTKKRIYVGNLGSNVNADDLTQLFGLGATKFLQDNCCVELSTDDKGKSKNFAIVECPEHVHAELMKLNGIEFYGRQIVIEEAKTKSDNDKEKGDKHKHDHRSGAGRNTRGGRNNNNSGGGRGGGRGGYNSRGRGWGGRPMNKYNLPNLEPDQIFHLVDCGVNLTNPKFNQNTDYVIARALSAGVQKMAITGLKLIGCKTAVIMAKTRPNVLFAVVGVHPHFVKDDWKDDGKTLDQLEELVKQPECVAVGEVGLDYLREYSPKDLQLSTFKQQVQLAVRYQKALLVHERESHEKIMEVLKSFENTLPPVVMHCFTGTAEQIKTYVAKGFYIGVTGYVCKEKHGEGLRAAIKDGTLPLKNIVIQSNAPYMVPNVPPSEIDPVSKTLLEHCYVENEPCTLSIIVRTIAKCLSQEPKAIADQLTENATNVFRFHKAETNFE